MDMDRKQMTVSVKKAKCRYEECVNDGIYHGKCIFHCDKTEETGWFTIVNGNKKWNEKKVTEFWNEFENILNKDIVSFCGYIFPVSIGKGLCPQFFNKFYTFKECEFVGVIGFHSFNVTALLFTYCKFKDKVRISPKSALVIRFFINTFYDDIELYNIDCKELSLIFQSNVRTDARIRLNNVKMKKLGIYSKFHEEVNLSVISLTLYDTLSITNTLLNESVFQDCDFAETNKLKLQHVTLAGTRFSNVDWGKIDKRHIDAERDIIRQLKHANDQQGNYIQANKFYSLEMDKYGEEIKDSNNFKEKFIFFIGRHLSNFSQNWMLPIFWFFFLSTALFNFQIIQNANDFWPFGSIFLLVFIFTDKISKRISYEGSIFFITISWIYYFFSGTCKNYLEFSFSPTINFNENIELSYMICFISFKLISILIGYHLVTALRFHTRRK